MGKQFNKDGETQKLGIGALYDKAAQTRQDKLNKAMGDDMERQTVGEMGKKKKKKKRKENDDKDGY